MNPKTFTSDLILDLEESVGTDALETIGSEYVELPVKSTPAEPTRAVVLFFDEWRRTSVLEQVGRAGGRAGGRVHLDCRRRDFPDWLGTGDGPGVIVRLLAHEPTVVDDGPGKVDGALDPARIRSITPEGVQGVQFWGRGGLDLTGTFPGTVPDHVAADGRGGGSR